MAIVYMATNSFNGKRYVGETVNNDIEKRKYAHKNDAENKRTKQIFHKAIRKYGFDAFTWEILAIYPTKAQALAAEVIEIAARKPEYNITAGGSGVIVHKRWSQWGENISASLKKIVWTEEMKDRSRKYIARAHEANKISIICLNDGKVFPSIGEAAIFYGIGSNSISETLSGRQWSSGGKNFAKLTDIGSLTLQCMIDEINKERSIRRKEQSKNHGRMVKCESDGLVFDTATEAAKNYKVSPGLVCLLCRTGKISGGGLRFSYISERRFESDKSGHPGRPVICINDRKVYTSAAEAAREYGLDNTSPGEVCRGKTKSVRGLVFRYLDEPNLDIDLIDIINVGPSRLNMKPIICCADGKKYDCIGDAASEYDVTLGAISAVLCGKAKTAAGGRVFRYADDPSSGEIIPIDIRRSHTRSVFCETDGKTYGSLMDAARHYGVNFRYISEVLRGKKKDVNGIVFSYSE